MELSAGQGDILQELNRKMDLLSEQIDSIQKRHQALEELKTDIQPIVNDGYHLLVEELEQVGEAFTLDDLFELGRRLLRSTRTLNKALEQLNSLDGLLSDLGPLGKEIFSSLLEQLSALEKEGHLDNLRELAELMKALSEELKVEDLSNLRSALPSFVQLLRLGTQTQVLELLKGSLESLSQPAPPAPGVFGMLKVMKDPEIRQGLGLALQMLRQMGRLNQYNKQITQEQ